MTNVLSIVLHKELKNIKEIEESYRKKISSLDFFELIEEIARYQGEKQQCGGNEPLVLLKKGRILYQAVKSNGCASAFINLVFELLRYRNR